MLLWGSFYILIYNCRDYFFLPSETERLEILVSEGKRCLPYVLGLELENKRHSNLFSTLAVKHSTFLKYENGEEEVHDTDLPKIDQTEFKINIKTLSLNTILLQKATSTNFSQL